MGKGLEQTFLQRRCMNCQQAHEKTFNITNCQENTNQSHNEIPPHTHRQLLKQKQKQKQETEKSKCWPGCGETGTLCTVGGKVLNGASAGKQYGGSSKT